MKSSYVKSKHAWNGLRSNYVCERSQIVENFAPCVTLPMGDWMRWISDNPVARGSVIPGGTMDTVGGMCGAVYTGHVRQGY